MPPLWPSQAPAAKRRQTTNKFGPIVHAYTMQRAVEDRAVTPLLYEERIPDLDVNERAIDSWFDRITEGLNEEQKADLKRKFAKKGQIYSAEDRIRLVHWILPTTLSKTSMMSSRDNWLATAKPRPSSTSSIWMKQVCLKARW